LVYKTNIFIKLLKLHKVFPEFSSKDEGETKSINTKFAFTEQNNN
jgi:hypothetical protein